MNDIVRAYKIVPGGKLKKFRTAKTLKSIDAAIGGIPEFVKVKLRGGKQVSIVFDSAPMNLNNLKDYNFTLRIVPNDKKTWIDFMGPVLIMGRQEDELVDIDLDQDEIDELISHPYDD